MTYSDGSSDHQETPFQTFLRETSLRRIENDLDKLRWENFRLKAQVREEVVRS